MRIRYHALLIMATALIGLLPLAGAQAQGGSRYFPETGHTVSGAFLSYWENRGGLPVFGYPLSGQRQAGGRDVQYFERQRFEAHPELSPPYNVLLGRLGAERLSQRGIDWQTDLPAAAPQPNCLWFPETRHNLCDQSASAGFRSYWSNHGLEFDGVPGFSYAESLALFGYPISEVIEETVEGRPLQVQWFERARFEWHPDNPQPYRVLLGRLGYEVLQIGGDPQPPSFTQVRLYYVALGDNGQSGQPIGCGDSIIPVTVDVAPTTMPLTAAYERLLANHDQYYGQSGLYNPLYDSRLTLRDAQVNNGVATVSLVGDFRIGGVCDNPRVEAQLTQVALQFSSVQTAEIYINGQRLEDALSQR